ncbi:transcription factor ORG2-like [Melia azedarach]|uniref:Transcription factor ORG2-like n=1 Tax=Melia azedarach TaxID=155640 RepID=A0ACC1Z169_MELAZ|nr:transcription factor ORG2-like [Melia azedarach]
MSSPTLNNPNHEDHNFSFPTHDSDDLWPLLADESACLGIQDYDIDHSLDPNIFHQENSSVIEASINETLLENRIENDNDNGLSVNFEVSDNPSVVLPENSILPTQDGKSNCEWDSFLFLEQENSAIAESVIDKRLLGSWSKYHDDNSLSTTLNTFENLCPNLEECSMSLSNKSHDTSGSSDPSTLLEQENSALEQSIHKELQKNIINYSNDDVLSNYVEAPDEPWPLVKEGNTSLPLENHGSCRELESSMLPEKESSAIAAPANSNKGLPEKQVNAKKKDRNQSTIEEHNAKERVRRMKLYSTYLSLGALLPDSGNKKRSAPAIIGRALEYIPELEKEIEQLTLKKNNLVSTFENKQTRDQNPELEHEERQAPTVSVHEVKEGEVIIQITRILKDEDTIFSKLMQNLESEGKSIVGVSTIQVSEKRVCYHLHIQMNSDSLTTNYLAALKEQVVLWLL